MDILADREDAFNRLEEIQNEINELAGEAADLVQSFFPDQFNHADAYGVFNMTDSHNRHDTTFETMLQSIADDLEI